MAMIARSCEKSMTNRRVTCLFGTESVSERSNKMASADAFTRKRRLDSVKRPRASLLCISAENAERRDKPEHSAV